MGREPSQENSTVHQCVSARGKLAVGDQLIFKPIAQVGNPSQEKSLITISSSKNCTFGVFLPPKSIMTTHNERLNIVGTEGLKDGYTVRVFLKSENRTYHLTCNKKSGRMTAESFLADLTSTLDNVGITYAPDVCSELRVVPASHVGEPKDTSTPVEI